MAKTEDKKKIAQKLIDLPKTSEYFADPNASGLKKFVSKHPVEVLDEPYDNEDDMYNAQNTDKDTSKENTRKRAIAKVSDRGLTYEEHMTPAQKRRREALVKKMKGHFTGYGKDNEKVMYATATKRAMRGEEFEIEESAGEPMAPAVASSDNPGGPTPTAGPNAGDGTMDDQDNDGNEGNLNVEQAKDFLETIAMEAAELYEGMPSDADIPDWAMEKLELAKNFVTSIHQHISDSAGAEDDEDEEGQADGGNNQDQSQSPKPTAFKGGQSTLAKEEASPSAGLSVNKKSEVAKKARHGGDIGKEGKGFEDLAAKAAKKYGSKETGEKVAAAAMWKHIKR